VQTHCGYVFPSASFYIGINFKDAPAPRQRRAAQLRATRGLARAAGGGGGQRGRLSSWEIGGQRCGGGYVTAGAPAPNPTGFRAGGPAVLLLALFY